MAYVCNATVTISWVGDGVGQMMPGPGSPLLKLVTANLGGPWQVPGGDSPSGANLTTVGTTIGTAIGTALNLNLTQIQGWSTGITS